MKVDYLFLIPLNPESASNDMRRALRKICLEQVSAIKASKKVWLLGTDNSLHPDFEAIKTAGRSKEDKLFEAGFLLEREKDTARYLVRLDDDDLVNPAVFDAAAKLPDFDCFYDHTHWFYDMSSGRCSTQQRPWIPNTAIHRMEHAMMKVPALGGSTLAGDDNFLFACDHSRAWHAYYTGMNLVKADQNNPLYLRVLSPRSRSAGGSDEFQETFPYYLQRFGTWKSHFPFQQEKLHPMLKQIWEGNEGPLREWTLPSKSFVSRFLNKIKTAK
jgi:hypothetical protein